MKQILFLLFLLAPVLATSQFISYNLITERTTFDATAPGTYKSPWQYSRADSTLYRWNYTTLAWEDWKESFGGKQVTLANTTTGFDLQAQFALGQSVGSDSVYYLYNTPGSDVGGGILSGFAKVGVIGKTGSNFWMDFVYPGTTEAFKYFYFQGATYESNFTFSSSGLNIVNREDRGGLFLTNYFVNNQGIRLRGGSVGFSPTYASTDYVFMPNSRTLLDSALVQWYPDGTWTYIAPSTLGGSGGVTDGDKGDITVTSGVWSIDDGTVEGGTGGIIVDNTVTTADIADGTLATADYADNSVTLAKINDGTANTLLGRDGTGGTSEIAVSTGLSLSGGVLTATGGAADGYLADDLVAGNKTISSGTNILRLQLNAGSYSEYSNSAVSIVGNAGSSSAGLNLDGFSFFKGNHNAYYENDNANPVNEGLFVTTIADGDSAQVVVQADSDAENAVVRVRRRMTTGDYPTAGTQLGRFMGYGYGGNTQIQGYGSGAGLRLRATETFTATAGATAVDVVVDQTGTTGQLVAATFDDDGTLDMKGHNVLNSPSVITALHTYAPSTGAQTLDLDSYHKTVEQVDLTSASSPLTLTVNNPIGGSGVVGFYTFHFTNASSTDVVFPAAFISITDGTSVGTQSFTAGGQITCYYDGTNYHCQL